MIVGNVELYLNWACGTIDFTGMVNGTDYNYNGKNCLDRVYCGTDTSYTDPDTGDTVNYTVKCYQTWWYIVGGALGLLVVCSLLACCLKSKKVRRGEGNERLVS